MGSAHPGKRSGAAWRGVGKEVPRHCLLEGGIDAVAVLSGGTYPLQLPTPMLVDPLRSMNVLALISSLAGGPGIIVLLLVTLLFGAKRLPELARGLGQSMREFQKGKDGAAEDDEKKPTLKS